ncbi:fungal-specific transcription factor domain-containing protein [Alternaria rosae]|uniref:fungal-specific transcription factor domain-containing protein n=1 Tax=Alternaria rosae TaxID=1187941 RepID=UPI001E8EC6C4|nr:fungal-specific transcription factor domain-containing protein [Alternaria rosae]KAH6861159.1 fungal-specific transcription factor domain-containing protein [Alternaria rosae]
MDVEPPRPTKKRHLAAEERQRAVRACDECRRLKEKCEDGSPCRRCRHLRRPCRYNVAPAAVDKRGPGLPDSPNELMERMRCMEFIIKHHFPNLALDIVSLQRTCDSLSSPTPPRDQNAIVPESIELSVNAQVSDSPDIGDEDCTIDRVDGTTVHYSGEFSHWNFSMHIKRNIDELMAKANVQNSENVTRVPDFIRVGEADPASTSISDILAVVPPRPVATFLTNVFFNHATSVYYYVDRRWLDDILDRIYTNPIPLRSKDVTAICVVLMVLAVGTQYVHLESPDRHKTCSTGVPTNSEVQSSWELEIGSGFYRHVAKLLSEVIHAGSLLSVQVLLLLGLYSLPIDASGLSYIYLNLAIKVAIQNGMHRKVSRNVLDARTKEVRRRIWWTVYCMERHAEAFLHEISCLRTCANAEVGVILNRIKRMKADLQGPWSPPRGSALLPTANHQAELPKSRALIHSRLECCLLHMFIGRPFILAHRQARTHVHSKDANAASPELRRRKASESHSQWDFLVQDCVAAAKEVISACQIMQTGDMGLAKSSYAEYSSCRASLLVLIAYSICYRTNEFANTLQIGLQAIREMASAGDSARSEVSLLETLEAALHRLHVFNPLPSQPAVTEANDSAEEGYNGLLNWYKKAERTTNPRFGPLASEHANVQAATAQGPRMTPNGADATVDSMPSYVPLDGYPFDFDLLNSDGGVAFFTSDFDDHGNTEREFFESLSWLPK